MSANITIITKKSENKKGFISKSPIFYFLNPNFSQPILNGQTPVSAANGKMMGGNQCIQLMLSKPAKQFPMKTTTPIDRNVILADGDASPKLQIFFIIFVLIILLLFLPPVSPYGIEMVYYIYI